MIPTIISGAKMRNTNRALLLCLFVLICLILPRTGYSKILEGDLETKEEWVFLGRFCFVSEKGKLRYEFEYPQKDYEAQNLILYLADQWSAVYKSDKTCEQKQSVLVPEDNQIIHLTPYGSFSGCVVDSGNIVCKGGRSFKSVRARWWFLVVSHCNSPKGLKLKYKLNMTNGEYGDIFFQNFSADDFYVLQVYIAFLVLFLGMLYISIVCGGLLCIRHLFHRTYKLYLMSLFCKVFYLILMCIVYGKYANDGREDIGLKIFGRVFESVSSLSFLLLLILIGKGYAMTQGQLSHQGLIKIAVFMTIYCIAYIILFICEAILFDPGESLYIYESPPGYGLIVLRLLGWIWSCYTIFFSFKHFRDKLAFYCQFFIFCTIYFWLLPVVILIVRFEMEERLRSNFVNGMNLGIDICGFLYFLILTRPTPGNKSLPMIGIKSPSQSAANSGIPMSASTQSESSTRYVYEPSAPPNPPPPYGLATANNSEVFTVSNTHSKRDVPN